MKNDYGIVQFTEKLLFTTKRIIIKVMHIEHYNMSNNHYTFEVIIYQDLTSAT